MIFRHRPRWQRSELKAKYDAALRISTQPRQSVIQLSRQRDYGIIFRPAYIGVSGIGDTMPLLPSAEHGTGFPTANSLNEVGLLDDPLPQPAMRGIQADPITRTIHGAICDEREIT